MKGTKYSRTRLTKSSRHHESVPTDDFYQTPHAPRVLPIGDNDTLRPDDTPRRDGEAVVQEFILARNGGGITGSSTRSAGGSPKS